MIARRQFLAGVVATSVLGFNPSTRQWLSVAHAFSPFEEVPRLDGVLVFDAASRAADAVDVGNIVHRTPVAVLRPGSVTDIEKMIRFCRRFHIRVAARGQGHTTFGQSQVESGLVIEMHTLSTIHSIGMTSADVDAGVLWKDLVEASVPLGVTPPALTGFTGLSIGGTLSVGGISASYLQGAQVDRVQELEIVTGEGNLTRCSANHNKELFEVALGGLGQCGIITRAIVDMVPASPFVRIFMPTYTDNAIFFDDMRTLVDRGEFRDIFTRWIPSPSGFIYGLNAVQYFDPSTPPDNAHLLRGLSIDPATTPFVDVPYLAYVLQVDSVIDQLIAAGLWNGVLHPWFDAFLPASTVERYVGDVIPTLRPDDVGATGFLLLFPHKRRAPRGRSLLRLPETELVFLFDILTAAATPGPDPAFEARMLRRNRALFEKARAAGGTRYPIGSLVFDHADWVQQYGEEWPEFVRLKERFDPDGILTPGPRIFQDE